jgi:hypothetical protein
VHEVSGILLMEQQVLSKNGKLYASCLPAGGQAGFSKTRSHRVRQLTDPSLQIPAKADKRKRRKPYRQPAGWQAWRIQHVAACALLLSVR